MCLELRKCSNPKYMFYYKFQQKAYDEEDPDTAKRALSSPFIMHMDVEYARLARDLPLPKGMAALPTKKQVPEENVSEKCLFL